MDERPCNPLQQWVTLTSIYKCLSSDINCKSRYSESNWNCRRATTPLNYKYLGFISHSKGTTLRVFKSNKPHMYYNVLAYRFLTNLQTVKCIEFAYKPINLFNFCHFENGT